MPEEMESFIRLSDRVVTLYDLGEAEAALAEIARVGPELPGYRSTLAYWSACLHAVSGHQNAAIAALQEASALGCWWSENLLRGDVDLAPLQGVPAFEQLVDDSRRREHEARASSRPRLLRTDPQGDVRAVLLALHGAAWRAAEDFAVHWQTLTDHGVTVAVPQSSQPTGDNSFGWDDREQAAAEVAEHERRLRREALGRCPLLLAGFSQGGTLALQWTFTGSPFAPDGFIAVNPGVNNLDELLGASEHSDRREPGVIFVGDRDPRRTLIETLAGGLTERGYPLQLVTMPDTGHWFSPDFGARLTAAVNWLLTLV